MHPTAPFVEYSIKDLKSEINIRVNTTIKEIKIHFLRGFISVCMNLQ